MESVNETLVKKKRKSNFDVPPEAIQNTLAAQNLEMLLKYSLDNIIPNSSPAVGFKDPLYEKRLKLALERNFEYIRRFD
jgi:hypothetical protein